MTRCWKLPGPLRPSKSTDPQKLQRNHHDLIINVVVYGTVERNKLLRRDAARPGDVIVSTGYLGNSKAGRYLILAPEKSEKIRQEFKKEFERPLFEIGKATDNGRVDIIYPNGTAKPVSPAGWDHFRIEKV